MLMQHMCKVKYIVLTVGVPVAATGTPLKFYAYECSRREEGNAKMYTMVLQIKSGYVRMYFVGPIRARWYP